MYIGNNCTIVRFNVSISSVNIIYIYIYICVFRYLLMYTNSFIFMYYNVLPNKLTHSPIMSMPGACVEYNIVCFCLNVPSSACNK